MGGGGKVISAHSGIQRASKFRVSPGSGGGGEGQGGAFIPGPPWEETPRQLANPFFPGGWPRRPDTWSVQTSANWVSRRSQSPSGRSGEGGRAPVHLWHLAFELHCKLSTSIHGLSRDPRTCPRGNGTGGRIFLGRKSADSGIREWGPRPRSIKNHHSPSGRSKVVLYGELLSYM